MPKPPASYVGIDVHAEDCVLCALDRQGKARLMRRVPTSIPLLRQALEALPKRIAATWESGPLAPWLHYGLQDLLMSITVAETRENRWIARSQDKDDFHDAERLARLLWLGQLKPVHVPVEGRQRFRELMLMYHHAKADTVRAKNRLKAKFRQHGIRAGGQKVYGMRHRAEFLDQLPDAAARFMAEACYRRMDQSVQAQAGIWRKARSMVRGRAAWRHIKTIPGWGPVTAATLLAVVDTPERFANKRRLWSYASLGKSRRGSGKGKPREGASYFGNRLLKWTAKIAAKAAIVGESEFAEHYRAMVARGVSEGNAVRTVARRLLAVAWVLWKKGEVYRPMR
jgi:transposase